MSKALKAQKMLKNVLKKAQASQDTKPAFNPRPSQLAAEMYQATRDWDRLSSMTLHTAED